MWYCGPNDGVTMVELASASNMKRTWCPSSGTDWSDDQEGEGREFLREAVQVKNIWIPYGE
jgi:aldehyde dehydrogenase (NAD+)